MSDRELRAAERAWTSAPDDPETLPALWLAWLRAGAPSSGPLGDVITRWREEGRAYVSAINAFVARGERDGWEAAGPEPSDTRHDLAEQVFAIVEAANRADAAEPLREHLPPAWGPLLPLIEEEGRTVRPLLLLEDGSILAGVGGALFQLDRDGAFRKHAGILAAGRSPDRRWFAVGRREGVTIHDGWGGPTTTTLAWPTGQEDAPPGYDGEPLPGPPRVTQLIPLDEARAVLVCGVGFYLLTVDGAVRLPSAEADQGWESEDGEARSPFEYMSMEHACVSPDGELIAVGSQSYEHRVIASDDLAVLSSVGPVFSEYPHHAVFSADGEQLALNSCHFYNGGTAGIPTRRLRAGVRIGDFMRTHPDVTLLDDRARVYASAVRADEYVLGDANGYLLGVTTTGTSLWRHFCGSTVTAMDISADGRALVVATFAGQVHVIELDAGVADPFQIGTSPHRERWRWLLWERAGRPLRW